MTEKAISPLRQRLIDDMAIRQLGPKTQHEYIRHVKSFADFVGRSPDKATTEDDHRYQLQLASIGATASTVNACASALRFFFKVTLKRRDLASVLVDADDVVAEIGKAGPRNEADIAGADHCDAHEVQNMVNESGPHGRTARLSREQSG